MTKYKMVDNYIKKVISDACTSEKRTNDVIYRFCIVEDNVVMELFSRYRRVEKKIEYRLKNNLPKNFGLKYNEDFHILDGHIDVNLSVDTFDGNSTIVCTNFSKPHLLPPYVVSGEKNNTWLFLKLNNGKPPKSWKKYLQDYKKIYGVARESIAIWE